MADLALLACEGCTRRKTKCDKLRPACSRCAAAGVPCIPVLSTRRPRGKNGGRPKGNSELYARISRLETLVCSLTDGNALANSAKDSDSRSHPHATLPTRPGTTRSSTDASTTHTPVEAPELQESHEPHGPVVPPSAPQVSIGTAFFSQLRDEIGGIREILDWEDYRPWDGTHVAQASGTSTPSSAGISRALLTQRPLNTRLLPVPNSRDVIYLLDVFRDRVTPVVKVVHPRLFDAHMRSTLIDHGHWAHDVHVRVLQTAAFMATVCSLTEDECRQWSGRTKSELQHLWRAAVEDQLALSDFLQSDRIETLQALILYLAAVRSHDNSKLTWLLLPIAIRMAQNLLLHREDSYRALSFRDAHLRRCLWYCLLTLDFQAAMDRGSDTIIAENSSNTKPPLHVSDADVYADTDMPPPVATCFTDMTFFAMECECAAVVRSLNFVQPRESEQPPTLLQYSWKAREEVVDQLEARFVHFLSLPDPDHHAPSAYQYLRKTIITSMRLYVLRPLQRHPAMTAPPTSATKILPLATEVLSAALKLYEDTYRWSWFIRGFNNWHPLAVMLAELCVAQEYSDEVSTAWSVAQRAYEELGKTVAEGVSGPLWVPMRKLMGAAESRQQALLATLRRSEVAIPPHEVISTEFSNAMMPVTNGLDGAMEPWAWWESFVGDLTIPSGNDWNMGFELDAGFPPPGPSGNGF